MLNAAISGTESGFSILSHCCFHLFSLLSGAWPRRQIQARGPCLSLVFIFSSLLCQYCLH